jgi:hypothetical protein
MVLSLGAVGLLEEKQVAAFVDDAYGHLHVSLVRFRFRRGGYCFNGRQIQPFPAGKFDGAGKRYRSKEQG